MVFIIGLIIENKVFIRLLSTNQTLIISFQTKIVIFDIRSLTIKKRIVYQKGSI